LGPAGEISPGLAWFDVSIGGPWSD
jgi:hypothetical protein